MFVHECIMREWSENLDKMFQNYMPCFLDKLLRYISFCNLWVFIQAECRLAARRQARAEAREIRMREIERQQREAEENADKIFDMHNAGEKFMTSTIHIQNQGRSSRVGWPGGDFPKQSRFPP